MRVNTIIQGDVIAILKTLPDECVDCIITSPPYYGLRDYGVNGQIGLESSLSEYINKMLLVTAELKRVLKKTGTMWWNHGDSYGGSGMGTWRSNSSPTGKQVYVIPYGKNMSARLRNTQYEKCMMMQNYRLAIRMIDEQQWILRNQIIWYKPNVMPSSVKDRFTVDFEPVFFFVKNKKYWFEPQYEQLTNPQRTNFVSGSRIHGINKDRNDNDLGQRSKDFSFPLGRNKRAVWKIPTQPFKEAHFATFPEKLIEPMIKAGCPEGGIVLDPFIGSGTTGLVAKKLGRNYLGIELNPNYIKIAEKRLAQDLLF